MKTIFTKAEILANKGCYSSDQINSLLGRRKKVKIIEILSSPITIKDKRWFVYNACDLTLDEKKKLALKLAWVVLPIYENKYPNDSRIKDCLQATEDFYSGNISLSFLKEKKSDAAYAADVYADIYADAYADAADAYAAAYAACAAAYADAYAADVKNLTYSQLIQHILIDFVK